MNHRDVLVLVQECFIFMENISVVFLLVVCVCVWGKEFLFRLKDKTKLIIPQGTKVSCLFHGFFLCYQRSESVTNNIIVWISLFAWLDHTIIAMASVSPHIKPVFESIVLENMNLKHDLQDLQAI